MATRITISISNTDFLFICLSMLIDINYCILSSNMDCNIDLYYTNALILDFMNVKHSKNVMRIAICKDYFDVDKPDVRSLLQSIWNQFFNTMIPMKRIVHHNWFN